MDTTEPRPRFSMWSLLAELAFLGVILFFVERVIELAGWQNTQIKAILMLVLYVHIGWQAIPLGVVLNRLLQLLFDA